MGRGDQAETDKLRRGKEGGNEGVREEEWRAAHRAKRGVSLPVSHTLAPACSDRLVPPAAIWRSCSLDLNMDRVELPHAADMGVTGD